MVREISEEEGKRRQESADEDADLGDTGTEGAEYTHKTKRTRLSLPHNLTPPPPPPSLTIDKQIEKTPEELEALKSDKYEYSHYILLVSLFRSFSFWSSFLPFRNLFECGIGLSTKKKQKLRRCDSNIRFSSSAMLISNHFLRHFTTMYDPLFSFNNLFSFRR